jgi:hypothetical protein
MFRIGYARLYLLRTKPVVVVVVVVVVPRAKSIEAALTKSGCSWQRDETSNLDTDNLVAQ